ncbi:hypothetical protein O1611_g9853 [Lasiodiplodia mahajangana]|uniref:Uncharacterized protein n=1 Tax=Lasiodiplodia mahajangana TaxID=1108764 RepID=A0ACC2J4G5_9PEZI|nr:hypothetical protein O1611_g9853 [Lasiodiplodia mahajangana]
MGMFGIVDMQQLLGVTESSPTEEEDCPDSPSVDTPPTDAATALPEGNRGNTLGFASNLTSSPGTVCRHECHYIMLALLQELHLSNPKCESAASTPAPTTKAPLNGSIMSLSSTQIMKSNSAALQHLNFLLERSCRFTCLAQLESMYLLHSISSTILARYEDLFDCIAQHSELEACQTPSTHHQMDRRRSGQPGVLVFDPIQLLDFPLGRQAEVRVNSELLLCEVQGLAMTITKMDDFFRDSECNSAGEDQQYNVRAITAHTKESSGTSPHKALSKRVEGLKGLIKDFRDKLA